LDTILTLRIGINIATHIFPSLTRGIAEPTEIWLDKFASITADKISLVTMNGSAIRTELGPSTNYGEIDRRTGTLTDDERASYQCEAISQASFEGTLREYFNKGNEILEESL
jgi:hypothetical protein